MIDLKLKSNGHLFRIRPGSGGFSSYRYHFESGTLCLLIQLLHSQFLVDDSHFTFMIQGHREVFILHREFFDRYFELISQPEAAA